MIDAETDPQKILLRPYEWVLVPENDGGASAWISEFPGCFSEGNSMEEALANLRDVATSWLEALIAQGSQVPTPKRDDSPRV